MASLLTLMHSFTVMSRVDGSLGSAIQVIFTQKLVKETSQVLSGGTSQMRRVCCWTDGKTRAPLGPSSQTPWAPH